ncbi:MAG: glycosyltransferase [Bacteroidetes bacterium]|nr:glycosyltransferase [Bacteroidota bacterium]
MKTILITAYAVNPYKGSEEGTGWNLICQAASISRVIAVTRKNNRQDIERYISEQGSHSSLWEQIDFRYFDLPKWMIRWKKGPLLSALYFYMWQFFVACWLKRKKLSFDIAHSLNFHSNWTPSFLWMLGKPFVWGPVGNHPLISSQYIKGVYGWGAWCKDRCLWILKCMFWYTDPFLYICRKKAKKVFCVNTQSIAKLRLPAHKAVFMPAVASELPDLTTPKGTDSFTILSAARFVPLKGFDLTIRAFAKFYHALDPAGKSRARLLLIGTGPCKALLHRIIKEENIAIAASIVAWKPRKEVIALFRQSSAFLFPSHEGAGMVVAEALSYQLPVLCLDNYGPGEYVHPESQLRVRQGNYQDTVDELAAKLSRLYHDQAFYQQEQTLAGIRYQELFRWDIKGELMEQVYNEIAPAATKSNIQSVITVSTYEEKTHTGITPAQ